MSRPGPEHALAARIRVLGIVGSLGARSSNLTLLEAAAPLAALSRMRLGHGLYNDEVQAMARYMFLLRADLNSNTCEGPNNEESFRRMVQWTETLRDRKKLAGVAPLRRANGRTVYPAGAQLKSVDGPFTEGKEVVVGYFVVEAGTLAEAESLARECPELQSRNVAIEIREVADFPISC
jgi:hypothetical protein